MSHNKSDDQSISDEDHLLRRLPPFPNLVKQDHNNGGVFRLTSAVFTDRETNNVEVSATHKEGLESIGEPSVAALTPKQIDDGWGLASISCGFLRHELKQIIATDPTDEDPFHKLIVGTKTKSILREMAKRAVIEYEPSTIKNQENR